ncbi:MAG: DUF4838 domain-containing protein, partial [Planctomycetes bacterium]|nr:DUF4838 domain-containing protein [Planctomycetota bacterium]
MGTVREVFLSAAVAAATVALPTLCQGAETGAPLPAFVENGQAAYRIEVGANATDSELLAVAELSTYLSRVTGLEQRPDKAAYLWQKERLEFARFYDGGAPSPEGIDGRKERIIYVGQTDFARANGLDGAAMAPEEWAVKTVGSNLILTGGRPRGTLYAVYDFLEQACGVWWLDRDTEVVPRNPNLALAPLDRRGKPKAWYRNLGFNGDWRPMGQKMSQFVFEARNRSPVSAFTAEQDMGWKNEAMYNANYRPKWGLETVIWDRNMRLRDAGEPFHTNCHSFYEYLPPAEFYAAHPEYYGLTRENAPKTLPTRGNGKMCLTHPEVRRIVTGRMLDLIRRDRAAERSFGTKPPRFYDLSMDDSLDPIECPCAACRDFVTKHGTESDLLLDFVNTVAAAVEKQYPDVTITTLAYSRYMRPPQTLKPRGNVLVEWCNWIVANFPSGHINTPVPDQALTHPDNAWRLESLRAWRGTGARLAVWEYMEYGYGSGIPATFAPYAIGNYQAYNEMGVEWFYECAIGKRDAVWSFENFAPLRRWMTLRLMADPACDVPRML